MNSFKEKMSAIDKNRSPSAEITSKVNEITNQIKTDSKNVSEEPMNETSNQNKLKNPSETPSSTRTSSDLLYSEYVKTEKEEKICGMFENKKRKPVIQSLGESPLYKKYSALLTELQESKDECPTGCEKELPVVEIHCLLKQKSEDNSEDSDCDIEDSRLIFYDTKNESLSDSSDEETSTEDEETFKENVTK